MTDPESGLTLRAILERDIAAARACTKNCKFGQPYHNKLKRTFRVENKEAAELSSKVGATARAAARAGTNDSDPQNLVIPAVLQAPLSEFCC